MKCNDHTICDRIQDDEVLMFPAAAQHLAKHIIIHPPAAKVARMSMIQCLLMVAALRVMSVHQSLRERT